MPKKKPEKEARRERRRELSEFLCSLGVSDAAGVHELFKELVSTVLENCLEGEPDAELGYSEKTVHYNFGEMDLKILRDRKGEVESQLVKKYQMSITSDIGEKILSRYAKGMSTSDIEVHIRGIHGLVASDSAVSRVTDKILPVIREWQQWLLENTYADDFMVSFYNFLGYGFFYIPSE